MGGSRNLRVNRVIDSDDAIPTWKEVKDSILSYSVVSNYDANNAGIHNILSGSFNNTPESKGILFSLFVDSEANMIQVFLTHSGDGESMRPQVYIRVRRDWINWNVWRNVYVA